MQGIMQDKPERRDIHAYLAFLEAEGTHGSSRDLPVDCRAG
jgi:hypothetical protein